MNIRDYLTKIHTHFQDHNRYKLLTHNPTNAVAHDPRTLIHYMHYPHVIDTTIMEFLLPPMNIRTPLFLTKILKPNCPLLCIVSGCDGPTDRLSSYVTHFIQPLAKNLPSHMKESKHFLNFIANLPPLPTNAVLVTADVASLYTNIPHDDVISAIIHFIEKYKHLQPTNYPPSPYSSSNPHFHS